MDEDRPLYAINDQVIVSRRYRHDEEDVPEGIATVVSFDVGYIFYDIRFNIDRYTGTKSGGLHFGMRKSLAMQYNDTGAPIGAVVVPHEGGDEQIDQTANQLLKYERPDVSNADVGTLLNELELLAIKAAFDREELEYDLRFQNAFAQHGIN